MSPPSPRKGSIKEPEGFLPFLKHDERKNRYKLVISKQKSELKFLPSKHDFSTANLPIKGEEFSILRQLSVENSQSLDAFSLVGKHDFKEL
jgi:hypothetical protein